MANLQSHLLPQTACARRSLAGMIGGGTPWEGAPMFDRRRREFLLCLAARRLLGRSRRARSR